MDLVRMSLSATLLIAVTALLRALTLYKLPKRMFVALWAAAALRLLLPYSIPFRFSVYSALPAAAQPLQVQAPAVPPLSVPPAAVPPHVGGAGAVGVTAAAQQSAAVSPLLLLYLAGVLGCAVLFGVAYVRCLRRFGTAVPVHHPFPARWQRAHPLRIPVEIRCSDRVQAPLTGGYTAPASSRSKNRG